jgi:DNA-binding response OmpR family regulator
MTVLLVDDDEDGVVLLQMILRRRGIASVVALSVAEGRRRLADTASLSAVVTDLHLGDGDGWSLLESASAVPKRIVLTGRSMVQAPPGVAVLLKPVDVDALVAALDLAEQP